MGSRLLIHAQFPQQFISEGPVVGGAIALRGIVRDVLALQRGFSDGDVLANLSLENLVAKLCTQALLDLLAQIRGFPTGKENAEDMNGRIKTALHLLDETVDHRQSLERHW